MTQPPDPGRQSEPSAAPSHSDKAEFLQRLRHGFDTKVPHSVALGMRAESATADGVQARLPCRPEFIGDPLRGVIHTGVLASLIDSVSGFAVHAHAGHRQRLVTLDLRIDYLRPSHANADLHCHAECYRLAPQIAFVRAHVWQDDREQPVATSLATFMRSMSRPQS